MALTREERQRRAVRVLREVAVEANLAATNLETVRQPDEPELARAGGKADELADRLLDAVVLLKGQL